MAALSACPFDADYWQARYRQRATVFEWYTGLVESGEGYLSAFLAHCPLPPAARLLDLGCGTSAAPFELATLGYAVDACDYAESAVAACLARAALLPGPLARLSFTKADARALPYESASFDGALDKATLDSLDCETEGGTAEAVQELFRVLKPGGALLTVSCRPPEERLAALAAAFELCDGGVNEVWAEGRGAACPTYWHALLRRRANVEMGAG